jgi:hypothetical protein
LTQNNRENIQKQTKGLKSKRKELEKEIIFLSPLSVRGINKVSKEELRICEKYSNTNNQSGDYLSFNFSTIRRLNKNFKFGMSFFFMI